MKIVTISSKGQITLPHSILNSINLTSYDKVLVEQQKDHIVLRPIKESVTEQLAGSLNKYIHPSKLGKPFDEIMEETRKKVAKHLATGNK